jgi:hypothetical protein
MSDHDFEAKKRIETALVSYHAIPLLLKNLSREEINTKEWNRGEVWTLVVKMNYPYKYANDLNVVNSLISILATIKNCSKLLGLRK